MPPYRVVVAPRGRQARLQSCGWTALVSAVCQRGDGERGNVHCLCVCLELEDHGRSNERILNVSDQPSAPPSDYPQGTGPASPSLRTLYCTCMAATWPAIHALPGAILAFFSLPCPGPAEMLALRLLGTLGEPAGSVEDWRVGVDAGRPRARAMGLGPGPGRGEGPDSGRGEGPASGLGPARGDGPARGEGPESGEGPVSGLDIVDGVTAEEGCGERVGTSRVGMMENGGYCGVGRRAGLGRTQGSAWRGQRLAAGEKVPVNPPCALSPLGIRDPQVGRIQNTAITLITTHHHSNSCPILQFTPPLPKHPLQQTKGEISTAPCCICVYSQEIKKYEVSRHMWRL